MDLFDAIDKRYSYRGRFLSNPIPRDSLQLIMEAGLAAPSGCNEQTTSLIGIDDTELMKRVAGLLGKPGFASAPAAICVLTQPIPAFKGRFYNVQDYAAVIENMLLAVTALGYASCWVEGYVTDQTTKIGKQMAAILNVPDSYQLVSFLPIGIPAESGPRAKRKLFCERAWFNGYNKVNANEQ